MAAVRSASLAADAVYAAANLHHALRYQRSIRAEAPYLPDNVEFMARNNGLPLGDDNGVSAVQDVIMSASYMVMGLGDVYLGAPCAVPLDPMHRLQVRALPADASRAAGNGGG